MYLAQRILARRSCRCNHLRSFTTSPVLPSEEKNEKDVEKPKIAKKSNEEEVKNKLNNLLNLMIKNDGNQTAKDIKIAKSAKPKREKIEKEKPLGEKLAGAAKEVAASLAGDVEKTESELLNILLRRTEPSAQVLKDVLKGIKVEKTDSAESRAQQVRATLGRHDRRQKSPAASDYTERERRILRKQNAVHVNILGAEPTSFFQGLKPAPAPCELRTWRDCEQRDMRLAVTHPPANIYEQMVLWTDRGMFWHFPIDNEQGLDHEKSVSFEEHIFLENHLEGWCPEQGPIRNFMELVCIGLSKNHWLSVEEKKEHIRWYRDYFADKKSLISELGAGHIEVDPKDQKPLFNIDSSAKTL